MTQAAAAGRPADLLGSDDPPRRRGRGLRLLAPAVLVVLSVLADRWQTDREVDALLDRAAAGTESVRYADGRVLGTVRYAAPAMLSPSVRPQVRASLRDLVRREAAGQVGDLRAERAAAADVLVLPWHGAQRTARDRWVEYLDARVAYLDGVAADFAELYREHPELEEARGRAGQAYRSAAPDETDRITELFGS